MANLVTTTAVIARIKDLADQTGSSFPDATQVLAYINDARFELFDMLVMTHEDYFITTKTLSLVEDTVTETSSLFHNPVNLLVMASHVATGAATDILKLRKVWQTYSGRRYAVPRASDSDIEASSTTLITGVDLELWYVPQLAALTNASSEVLGDGFGILPNGWDAFIVLHAAIKLMKRAEYDTRPWAQELAEIRQRIIATACTRDKEPSQVTDVNFRFSPRGILDIGRERISYSLLGSKLYIHQRGSV
jgi:hypothetical protein